MRRENAPFRGDPWQVKMVASDLRSSLEIQSEKERFSAMALPTTTQLQELLDQLSNSWSALFLIIGPMVAALLSDDNRWVNGLRIEVSGGVAL
jgi:hypothetical protein